MADLKSKTKERLLNGMIKCVKSTTAWKVLIVDTQSMRIISAACRMHDILDLGVSLVEKIENKREALPKMDAIYFLAPVEASVNLLIADFENPKRPQYAAAHLFFTSRLSDQLLAKIKSKMVVSKIKTLKELNLDYLAYEKRFFNLEIPNSFWSHYSPDSKDLKSEQMKMADKIVSVFVTLEDNPIIRYSASTPNTQQLATLVRERLDSFGQNVPEFSDSNEESHQSVLLILERAQDIITPLMHEFTYQAMVYDLLPIQNDHYKYMTTTNICSNKEKEVILGETDPLWVDLRHIHIADAMNRILDGFNEFVKQNKAAQVVSGVLKDVKEAQTKVDNLKEMSAAIKAMPQYQEMLDKYSLHINMATTVMKEYENRHLNKLAAIEQEISTGEDSDGKPIKNILSKLPLLLQDEVVKASDKLKLLMLYTISEQGLKDGDRVRLLQHAKLSNHEQNILHNLKYLGVNIVKTKNEKRKFSGSGKKPRSDAPSYELSRYTPAIKKIGEDFLTGTLSQSEFPTMNSLMSSPPPRSGPKFASSLRKAVPKWSNNAKKETIEMENTRRNGRFIIFVAGGITFSEMRCIYELASQYNREVILGSTSIVLPDTFVEQVASLKKDELVQV